VDPAIKTAIRVNPTHDMAKFEAALCNTTLPEDVREHVLAVFTMAFTCAHGDVLASMTTRASRDFLDMHFGEAHSERVVWAARRVVQRLPSLEAFLEAGAGNDPRVIVALASADEAAPRA
jgi:hypothetical protein